MTVRELIEMLAKMDQDKVVFVNSYEYDTANPVEFLNEDNDKVVIF